MLKKNKKYILYKFIAKHFAKTLIAVSFVLFAITSILCVMKIGRAIDEPVPTLLLIEFCLRDIFTFMHLLLPTSVLIATLITFNNLSKSHELVIIRSIGISIWQMAKPIVIILIFLGFFNAMVISPFHAKLREDINKTSYEKKITSTNPFEFSQNSLWLKEKINDTNVFIKIAFVKKVKDELYGDKITLIKTDGNNNLIEKLEAETGILKDKHFTLKSIDLLTKDLEKKSLETYEYKTNFSIQKIETVAQSPFDISFWELPKFIMFFKGAGFAVKNHLSYFYILLFLPLSLVYMFFIGLLFSISSTRRQVFTTLKLFAGFITGFTFLFLEQMVHAIGITGSLNLLVSVIIVPIIVILFSVNMLLYNEDG